MKKQLAIAIGVCILLISAANAHAKLRTWYEFQSDNFILYTDLTEKGAKHLLDEFETFREAVFALFGFQPRPENNRLRIIVYSRPSEYKDVRPSDNVVGFFLNTSAGPRMVIGPSRHVGKSEILYHEYVHHIMREQVTFPLPRWYNEGFAELLATVEIKGENVTIGAPNEERFQNLQFLTKLDLKQLFSPYQEDKSAIYKERFYATAWLFLHLAQISPIDTGSDLRNQTNLFVARIASGEDPTEAFEPSFGMTIDEMNRELLSYQKKTRFTVLKWKFDSKNRHLTKRTLSNNERAYVLAEIATRVNKDELALEYLNELDEKEKDAARGLALRAVLQNHNDNTDSASRARDSAFQLDDQNSEVLSNIAHHDWDNYERGKKADAPDNSYLQQALQHSQRAIELDPKNLDAYYFQWLAYQELNQVNDALKSMMAAYQIDPASIDINGSIGEYLMQNRRPDLAKPFIQRVYNWAHSEEQIQRAKDLLDSIEKSIAASGKE